MTIRYTAEKGCNGTCYTMEVDGKRVGRATVGDGVVERIDIIDGEQGKGYGTALLQHLVEAEEQTLVIVPDNEGAQRLYARLGYEMDNEQWNRWGHALDCGFGVYELS